MLVTGGTGFVGPAVVRALRAAGHDVRVLEREPGSATAAGLVDVEAVQGDMADARACGEPWTASRGRRAPGRDPHRQARGVRARHGAGHARPGRGVPGRGRAALRAHVRARCERGDEGSRPLLPRQVGDGADGARLGARARHLPAELRLRARRRRTAAVPEDREAGSGHADRRAGDAAAAADLDRGRRRLLRGRRDAARGREPDVRDRRRRTS